MLVIVVLVLHLFLARIGQQPIHYSELYLYRQSLRNQCVFLDMKLWKVERLYHLYTFVHTVMAGFFFVLYQHLVLVFQLNPAVYSIRIFPMEFLTRITFWLAAIASILTCHRVEYFVCHFNFSLAIF